MAEDKKKKRFTSELNNTVRIGPRISKPLYLLIRYLYSLQGITLEERIESLLRKDAEYAMKQKWFTDMAASLDGEDFQLFTMFTNPRVQKSGKKDKGNAGAEDDQFGSGWLPGEENENV